MRTNLAIAANPGQAVFATQPVAPPLRFSDDAGMPKKRTRPGHPMRHLRSWRDSLGLSRPHVVERMALLLGIDEPIDQATLAKWESGESAVKVEHIEILAQIYGVTPDRLYFEPGDKKTPEMLALAHSIIIGKDPDAVARWLASGADLTQRPGDPKKY